MAEPTSRADGFADIEAPVMRQVMKESAIDRISRMARERREKEAEERARELHELHDHPEADQ